MRIVGLSGIRRSAKSGGGGALEAASPLCVSIAPKNLSPTYFVLMLYAVSFARMANSEQPFIA